MNEHDENPEIKIPTPEQLETCCHCGGKFRILKDIWLDYDGDPFCSFCYGYVNRWQPGQQV